jgi:hypothetical protein
MRTESLLKLLRLGPLQLFEIFDIMGGIHDEVQDSINDAIRKNLITWKHCWGGRYYFLKQA